MHRFRNIVGAVALTASAAIAVPAVASAVTSAPTGPTLHQEFGSSQHNFFTGNVPGSAVIGNALGEGASGWHGVGSVAGGPTEPASFSITVNGRGYNVYEPVAETLAQSAEATVPGSQATDFIGYLANVARNNPGWRTGDAIVVPNGPTNTPI
jgi:hypothetical protein